MTLDNPSLVAILSLVATIAGFIYTWFKDGRTRRWQEEDAAAKSQHLANQDKAIQEGRQEAVKAYTEANQINEKIALLQEELRKVKKRESDKDEAKIGS